MLPSFFALSFFRPPVNIQDHPKSATTSAPRFNKKCSNLILVPSVTDFDSKSKEI